MRYAIFASTLNGSQQAERLKDALAQAEPPQQVEIFVHHKIWPLLSSQIETRDDWQKYERLSEVVGRVFPVYDGLIFIMAAGIVVRTLAPHVQSKLSDPAVLVMDDKGRNIISLLSGHVGGANRLTNYLAGKLGANPVITTATDVNDCLAPDVVAGYLAAKPFPHENLVIFNGGLLAGKKLLYYVNSDIKCADIYADVLKKHGVECELIRSDELTEKLQKIREPVKSDRLADKPEEMHVDIHGYTESDGLSDKLQALGVQEQELSVVVTDRRENLPMAANILYLHPRKLIAGVGCRKDTSCELIIDALKSACCSIGWPLERLDGLASTVAKAEEKGFLVVAESLALPIKFFDNQQLAKKIAEFSLKESAFVKETIGVGNICEAAALCCVSQGRIALPKTKYEKVTVALVWEK